MQNKEEEILETINSFINQFTPFNSRNPQHVSCMWKFWQILFPLVILDKESIENHSEFSLFTGIWSRFGFRGSDPTIDLRGGGIFALEQLVYMCENYTEYFVKCLKWQYDTSVETPLDAYPIIIIKKSRHYLQLYENHR